MSSHTERETSNTVRTNPGGSARQEADRRRQRAAELLRSAERWERSAAGEERVAASLAWLPPTFTTLHDLRLPGSPTNIDHLVIGPVGVFLIDTKVHDGVVRYGNGTLWRGRFPMRRELEALNLEAVRVGAVLDAPVVPAVCFADGELPRRNLTVGGVRILALAELLPFVAERAATVPAHEVERLVQEAERLARRTRPGRGAPLPELAPAVPHPPAAPIGTTATADPTAASARRGASGLARRSRLTGAVSRRTRARTGRRPLRLAAVLGVAGVASYLAGTSLLADARPNPTVGESRVVRPGTATSTPGPTPTIELPALRAVTSCPGPARGWTVEPQWPGLPAGAARYETSWRSAGTSTWILAGWWTSADQLPPLTLANLAAAATLELRLVAVDDAQRTVGERVTTVTLPTDPC